MGFGYFRVDFANGVKPSKGQDYGCSAFSYVYDRDR